MTFRIIFMGTPEFSVPTLSKVIEAGHEVLAVYSQPPRQQGRGLTLRKSPVHAFAEEMGIPVFTPKSLKAKDARDIFASHGADLAIVVAYGLILPKPILDAPRLGCFNIHASLLPRWRGAAPIQRAIMAGDTKSGVMIMKMDEGLDTGDVCLGEQVEIAPHMTASDLHDALSQSGADLMVRALAALSRDSLEFRAQPNEGVTYAEKIDKSEAKINWSQPAADVHNHIRGLSPFPGAWFEMVISGKTERVKVLRSKVSDHDLTSSSKTGSSKTGSLNPGEILDDMMTIACQDGAVQLLNVQRAGKKAMSGEDFLRGVDLKTGTLL